MSARCGNKSGVLVHSRELAQVYQSPRKKEAHEKGHRTNRPSHILREILAMFSRYEVWNKINY